MLSLGLSNFNFSNINWENLEETPASTAAVRTSANRTPTSAERASLIQKLEGGEALSQDEMAIVSGKKDQNVKPNVKNMTPREQLGYLEKLQVDIKGLLKEAKSEYADLTKTSEQLAQEQAAREAQVGKQPLASASGYGTSVMGNIPGEKPIEGVAPLAAASGYGTTIMGNIPGEKPVEGVMPLGAYSGYGTTKPKKNLPEGTDLNQTTNVETNFTTSTAVATNFTTTDTSTPTIPDTTTTSPTTSAVIINPPPPGDKGTPPPPPGGGVGMTTNLDVLKAMLLGMGFNSKIVDSSSTYLLDLLKDGLDYDNAVSIFLNLKDYNTKDGRTIRSPFYDEYGYLNEGLARRKPPAELYNAVEGYKEIGAKYNLNEKFMSKDYIKNYVKNDISVANLDERANTARLKAVNADPAYLDSLKKLGYISGAADLTDFFMDPTIGQETLEQRRGTAAFATEAIRRAGQGITFAGDRFGQTAANLVGLGLSEAQISNYAAQGFENIAEQLAPTQRLASIYQQLPATQLQDIQSELESEQFGGTASQRRKMLKERETLAFAGQSGAGAYSLRKSSTAGQL